MKLVFIKKINDKPFKVFKLCLLVLLFSGLLSIPFLDFERYYLTWIAFVPLLFAIENANIFKTYLLGTIAGFLAFSSGMYWIADFIDIAKGSVESVNIWLAILYWLYCSQLIAIILVTFKWLKNKSNVHEFILFPVLFASMTSAYPMLFSMRLADSQINLLCGTSSDRDLWRIRVGCNSCLI